MPRDRVLVAGGGGFIGGHLVGSLLNEGFDVRSVDVKPREDWYQVHEGAENLELDLRREGECAAAIAGANIVYNLAADMGGMGFIENNKALCMLSVLINTHLLEAARREEVERFFFSSSACVYAADKQTDPNNPGLKESDAYPAMPEDGYGWEKLFSERMCRHFGEDFGMTIRVARYHNVYGPSGTWSGGREKAPAAICRKIAEAQISGDHEIEIWGDGHQTRSFMYIDDCIDGTRRIMRLRDHRRDQSRQQRDGEYQRAGEHRRGYRRDHLPAQLRSLGAEGRRRAQQRQHAHPGTAGLGAEHLVARRSREDIRLGVRSGKGAGSCLAGARDGVCGRPSTQRSSRGRDEVRVLSALRRATGRRRRGKRCRASDVPGLRRGPLRQPRGHSVRVRRA